MILSKKWGSKGNVKDWYVAQNRIAPNKISNNFSPLPCGCQSISFVATWLLMCKQKYRSRWHPNINQTNQSQSTSVTNRWRGTSEARCRRKSRAADGNHGMEECSYRTACAGGGTQHPHPYHSRINLHEKLRVELFENNNAKMTHYQQNP